MFSNRLQIFFDIRMYIYLLFFVKLFFTEFYTLRLIAKVGFFFNKQHQKLKLSN